MLDVRLTLFCSSDSAVQSLGVEDGGRASGRPANGPVVEHMLLLKRLDSVLRWLSMGASDMTGMLLLVGSEGRSSLLIFAFTISLSVRLKD